jgi:hypothetical protein
MRGPLAAFAIALLASACVPNCGTDSLPQPATAQLTDSIPPGESPPDAGAGATPAPQPQPQPGACAATGTACGGAAECCSNRCSTTCGPMCFADGQVCSVATDCCSLACNGGTCGGPRCARDGANCTANEGCCSNACVGTKCVAVRTGCHPPGERCTGGGFAQNVCCGTPPAPCLEPGTANERCSLPLDVCRGAGTPCVGAGDCCSNGCVAGFCS